MRTEVLGVGFDDVTMEQAVEKALQLIEERNGGYVVTPNAEIAWICQKEPPVGELVSNAKLVLADGVGITLGARILGRPLQARVPGSDFIVRLFEQMARQGQSVFLFGAKPGIAVTAGERIMEQYPGLRVVGAADGYGEDAQVVDAIRAAKPDLLLVCLGAPKQERWMATYEGTLDTGLMAGLGGMLDVFAGVVDRAPEWWRKWGVEWLYRLIKEPRRAKRMLKLPLFLFAVIGERLRGRP
ncbi:MAG: WecB/TagA/CpsF family glycosyltransferase [Oscillospiraceae bacterium]|nr:WecB/TagA/CpsF family glycosyltransferase [Oscillospiraceae bacterium]